eukprot:scaffold190133_cov18-Tisochrysis_lutea.AAC.1
MEVDVGFVVLADDGDDESELSSESEDRHPPVLSVGASTDDEAEQGAEAEEEEGEGEGGEDKEPVVSFGMNEEEEVRSVTACLLRLFQKPATLLEARTAQG